MSDSDPNDRRLPGPTGGAYDPDRAEDVGDSAFDRDDQRGIEAVAFDTNEQTYQASPPDDSDISVDLFLYDPLRKESH